MCFEEQLTLDYLDWTDQQGIPHTDTLYRYGHTLSQLLHVASALTHSHQCNDVIRVLMRDYSDITGTAAKLNLLAPPCAHRALRPYCVSAPESRLREKCDARVSVLSYHPSIHPSINVFIKKKKQHSVLAKAVSVMSITVCSGAQRDWWHS